MWAVSQPAEWFINKIVKLAGTTADGPCGGFNGHHYMTETRLLSCIRLYTSYYQYIVLSTLEICSILYILLTASTKDQCFGSAKTSGGSGSSFISHCGSGNYGKKCALKRLRNLHNNLFFVNEMLKSNFRAEANDFVDFLVRVPTKIWPNLHLKWSKFINYLYFYKDLFELHAKYFLKSLLTIFCEKINKKM